MKTTFLRKLSAGILAAILTVGMTACNHSGSTPSVASVASSADISSADVSSTAPVSSDTGESGAALVLWGAEEDQTMLKEMASSFVTEHADKKYKVTVKVQGEDHAQTVVLNDVNAAADVFAIPHDQLGALAEAKACSPNTVYADEIEENDSAQSVSAATYKGTLYGYPSSVETYFMYYNKSVFTNNDVKSLDKMLEVAKAAKKTVGIELGNNYYSAAFWLAGGCKLFGDGTDVSGSTFNDANGLNVAKYIATLKSKGLQNLAPADATSPLTSGALTAQIGGPWNASDFKGALGDNYAVAKLPTVNIGGEEKQMVSFEGVKIYLVNSHTKYPNAAMQLAEYITNEKNQVKRFTDRGLVPANLNAVNSSAVTSDETVAAEVAQSKFATAMPSLPQMTGFWSNNSMAVTTEIYNGKIKEANFQTALDNWCTLLKSAA